MNQEPLTKLDDSAVNNMLPKSVKVEETDTELELVAYRLWFKMMDEFKQNGELSYATFTRFHLLEGNTNNFLVAAVFQVGLGQGIKSTSWGGVQEGHEVKGIVWKMKIKKDGPQNYTLQSFEKSKDPSIGLPPIQDTDSYQREVGIKANSIKNRYEIVNNSLRITYNNGKYWKKVPVEIEELFKGEYHGAKDSLIEGSYIIQPARTAFVLAGDRSLQILMTTDRGESWDTVKVTSKLLGVRMRLLGFTSTKDGYLIATAERTMSSEGNFVFKTIDGGKSWKKVHSPKNTSLVTDGGFISDKVGFISFGSINYENQAPRPNLYRTGDGGNSWTEVKVPIPDEYTAKFTVAETPIFNGEYVTLIVNQGPNGDYLGGKVVAKFISKNKGETWIFDSLVDPDKVLINDLKG